MIRVGISYLKEISQGDFMKLHFEPVTEKNKSEILKLSIAPGQEGFIEDVSECLQEASTRSCWRPVGIYDENLLVGFAMYGFFWDYFPFGRVWLDRLLIDEKYQGKGYGTNALLQLIEVLHNQYHRKKIYLSVVENNVNAIKLYEKYGFHFNGELDIHGEKVMLYQFKNN